MNRLLALFTSVLVSLLLLASSTYTLYAADALIYVADNCTLAQAIQSANQNQSFGGCQAGIDRDQIFLDRDLTIDSTLPTVTSIMVIDGNGHTVRGSGGHRLFEVTSGSLALLDLTLTNGFADGNGGAVSVNGGNLILRNSRIANSTATNGGGAIGVDNGSASVSLGSVLENNRAHRGGAVWVGSNGSLFSESGLAIVNNASSGTGGGIYSQGTVHFIGPGSIERNTASGRGGGIHSRGGNLRLESAGLRIAHNSAAGGGGVSLVEGADLNAIVGLYVGNNRASNGGGGGIGSNASSVTFFNGTIEGNSAPTGGGIWGTNANINVKNTVFRNNRSNGAGYDICAVNSTLMVDGAAPGDRPGMNC